MTPKCETVRDALPALARGTLDEPESALMHEHIAGCAACAADLRLTEALIAAREVAPDPLAPRVSSAMAHAVPGAARRTSRLPRAIRWSAGAAVALAATMALVFVRPQATERQPGRAAIPSAAGPGTEADADPFLEVGLFAGDGMPLDAQLDDILEDVDAVAVLPVGPTDEVPPLAMDLGSPAGDWPGADGTSAGAALLEDLTYDEMRLLLSEMDT